MNPIQLAQLNLVEMPPLTFASVMNDHNKTIINFVLALGSIAVLSILVVSFLKYIKFKKAIQKEAISPEIQKLKTHPIVWFSRGLRWVGVILAYIGARLSQANLPSQYDGALYRQVSHDVKIGFILFILGLFSYVTGVVTRIEAHKSSLKKLSQDAVGQNQKVRIKKVFSRNLMLSSLLQIINIAAIWIIISYVIQY